MEIRDQCHSRLALSCSHSKSLAGKMDRVRASEPGHSSHRALEGESRSQGLG